MSKAAATSKKAQLAGKAASVAATPSTRSSKKMPELEDFIESRDYAGAATLLEFKRRTDEGNGLTVPWLAYCAFHLGDYVRALQLYKELLQLKESPLEVNLYAAACCFHLQHYEEAESFAVKGPECSMKWRLLFHTAHKLNKDKEVHQYHKLLKEEAKVDALSLAAMHFQRSHFTEAADMYKKLLLENKDDIAFNAYIAMCYYKLDYYDVSLEALGVYLQSKPNSPAALNLKACNQFKLYNGKAAETELRALADQGLSIDDSTLLRHNLVVFRNGENAMRVLPDLLGLVPEARLNLVLYHLKQGNIQEAHALMQAVEPQLPPEYILKATVHAFLGQRSGQPDARDHLKQAQQYFNLVGASASECDTIPGRQCMASCYFLLRQFEDVNIYLSSIRPYLYADADFNWNYGLSLAAAGSHKEAEEHLLLVQTPAYTADPLYLYWLARCYIMNKKPRSAWEIYLKMDTSPESLQLLQLIAADCYRTDAFYFAAKAYDILERMDKNDPEYWEGKRGASVGVFQQVVAGKETRENLKEILTMLRNTSNPQVEYISRIIQRWMQSNGGL